MSEPNAESTAGSALNPADNPQAWVKAKIAERDAEPASSTGQSDTQASPAQPTVAESPTTVQPTSWRDTIIGDDVDHGFFRGKKAADVIESYKHAERAKQEAERERNQYRDELEALRRQREAELAARKVLAEQQAPAAKPDPYAEIEANWFENPRAAMEKLRETTIAEARQLAAQEAARVQEETQREWKQRSIATTGEQSFESARQHLNVDPETWNKRGIALLSTVTRQGTEYFENGGPLNPSVLVQAYKDLFGDPTPAAPIPAAPAPIAPPPGSSKPSRGAVPSGAVQSPLSDERRRLAERLANIGGFAPEVLINKWQGERRG